MVQLFLRRTFIILVGSTAKDFIFTIKKLRVERVIGLNKDQWERGSAILAAKNPEKLN